MIDEIRDLLTDILEGSTDYSAHDDYGAGYLHCVDEIGHHTPQVETWLWQHHPDTCGRLGITLTKRIASRIAVSSIDCEPIHSWNEYCEYSGDGCCLWGCEVDEIETQVGIRDHDILKEAWYDGTLEGILDELSEEFCIHSITRYNPETERQEHVGYFNEKSEYPTITLSDLPGGRWDMVVSADTMKEKLAEAICEECKESDDKLTGVMVNPIHLIGTELRLAEGERVILIKATNQPSSSLIDYFAKSANNKDYVPISRNDVCID